jgi:hypothetical protein
MAADLGGGARLVLLWQMGSTGFSAGGGTGSSEGG